MDQNLEDIVTRLESISEELGDRGLDVLRAARGADEDEMAELKEKEKRLARARRSVEKAAGLLRGWG